MKPILRFLWCGLFALILTACGTSTSYETKLHKPGDAGAFIDSLEMSLTAVNAVKELGKDSLGQANEKEKFHRKLRDTLSKTTAKIHRSLMANFPVYYDWWLQDGDFNQEPHEWQKQFTQYAKTPGIDWFETSLDDQVDLRLKKVATQMGKEVTPVSSVKEKFEQYVALCTERREKRLARFIKDKPEVLFTKFEVLRPSFFAYTEGLSDARAESNFFPNGELATLKMNSIWAEENCILKDTGGVFRDPDVHFDGQHAIFAWKKSHREDDFHIYEIDLKTRKVKPITEGLGHADIECVYLPDDNILFNSTRCGSTVDCWVTEVSNLYTCDREGRYMRRLGFDQVHTSNPGVLDDGRVVYTRWDYNDRGQVWTQPLFQMNPDGTGQAEYYGLNSWFPTTATHVRQIPGTRKIMATLTGHHSPQHGKIAIIDPEAGRDENEGVMMVAPYEKAEAVKIDSYGQYGDQFQYPFPMTETEFLVSYSPIGYYADRPIDFAIYWMDIDGNRELLLNDPTISCNQPKVITERERPFVRASTVDYTKDYGTYYVQNIYEGRSLDGIKKGDVKKLRIVEIEYRAAPVGFAAGNGIGGGAHSSSPPGVGNASWDLKKIHGIVDVYEDGSAFFEAPARTPLYFQALDSNGFVIQTMRSWTTLMPGEMQSCVGCHEHKNTVPVSNHPVSIAMDKGAQKITNDVGGTRNFSYIAEVQPILDRECISCHDGVKNKVSLKGELKVVDMQTLRKYSDSYLSLTHAARRLGGNESWQGLPDHPEVNWISSLSEPTLLKPYHAGAATSNLIKRLQNGHGGSKLSKDEISVVAQWIDMCVPFISDYKEANNWTEEQMKYFEYYEKKRDDARNAEKEAIRDYIGSLSK